MIPNVKVYAAAGIAIALLFGYTRYQAARLEALGVRLEQSEAHRASLEQSVADFQAAQAETQARLDAYEQNLVAASRETRRLRDVLSSHDLSRLASEKPRLVERAINRESDRLRLLLQCATSAQGCRAQEGAPPAP